jgi:hypothetical protein
MGLDCKISADEIYSQKSDFDRIPVVARSQPKRIVRMSAPRQPDVASEKVPRKIPSGSSAPSKSSISKKKN